MKNLTIAVLLSVFALSATAYEGPRSGQKMQMQNSNMHMEKLTKRLDLTEQQQEQIKALQANAQEKRNALDVQYNIEEYRNAKRGIGLESKAQFEEILTDEQKTKHQKMMQKHMKKHMKQQGKKGGQGNKRMYRNCDQ